MCLDALEDVLIGSANGRVKHKPKVQGIKTTEIWQLRFGSLFPVVIRANTTEPVSSPPGDLQTAKSL